MGIAGRRIVGRRSWGKCRKSTTHLMRRSTCNDLPLGYKREANSYKRGRRFGEDETLLKFVQSISSVGPVGLKKLRLFRETPVCSRQTPILQPTAIGGVGSTIGASRICKRSTFCINCKV
jgi:hypothetical protein